MSITHAFICKHREAVIGLNKLPCSGRLYGRKGISHLCKCHVKTCQQNVYKNVKYFEC